MKIRFAVSVGLGPPDPDQLVAGITTAEEQGFDSLWFSDLPVLAATDPFLAVATAAAVSRRLKLGVNLVPFGYQPFVFARQVAQLDRLTRGRLLLTLVPGLDQPGERAALGIGARHRGHLLDATIPDLRTWWAGGAVAVGQAGDDDLKLTLPTLPQQDPLEIWLGGSGPDAIDRVGRLADGWLGALMTPADAAEVKADIEGVAAQAGRVIDPEHFGLSIAYARRDEDLAQAPRLRRPRAVRPTPPVPVGRQALRDLLGQLIEVGLSKFVVRPVAPGSTGTSWTDELGWLADAVLDLQT